MKKLFFLALLVSASVAMADQNCSDEQAVSSSTENMEITTDVPAHLRGAKITVKLADGRESTVPAEMFKVVPRKQQFLVSKVTNATTRTCTIDKATKNRLSVLAGKAPRGGLDRSRDGNSETVESQYGFTTGIQYQRDTGVKVLGLPLNIGGQLQDNKGAFGTVGVDF